MKNKIVVILSLLIVFAAGALSVVSYENWKGWADSQHRKAVAAQQEQAKADLLQQVQFNRELDRLKAVCIKEQQDYNALLPAQKLKAVAPDCNAQLVQ
jgi:Flp pilus assembly protein CpaB